MEKIVLITHGDADGIISLSIALSKFRGEKPRIYFTHPAKLKDTLASLISRSEFLNRLFVFDMTANEKTMLLSSTFEKATWIDHHEWEISNYPPNVEVIVDKSAASAAELVAKYFNMESELVELANQIDKDEIKTSEAEFLRNLLGALRWKYSGALLYNKFLSLSKTLSFHELAELEQDMSVARLVDGYLKWLKDAEARVLERTKTFKVNKIKVAIYETTKFLPMYILTKKLIAHEDAPFDVIIGLVRQIDRAKRRIYTKLELRTQTNEDVYVIAKEFGGGGHRVAAAATLREFLTIDALLNKIKELKV
ncbi:MAG: phosphoesterase [Candidatus Aenigmarchaeota archaeon]|nr:phosphoesterase [Candidatus Aenigmarchaeota archaeon]